MCVFPCGCVWLRVCGGVSGCVRVSLRVGLSVNLLENENKPGSLAAVAEPRSSAASRQTVTAAPMTEHTHTSLRAFLIAPSDTLKQRKLKTKLIAINMSREQREAGSSPGGWELAAGREKGIGSCGQETRLGQGSAESWVGIGSTADPGRGLGALQHRRAGWPRWISHGNLRRILPGPRIFFFFFPCLCPDFLIAAPLIPSSCLHASAAAKAWREVGGKIKMPPAPSGHRAGGIRPEGTAGHSSGCLQRCQHQLRS